MIALLRNAQGGMTSGYGPLVILPVVWVALTLRRREVVVMAAAGGLLFGLPILLVGAPLYPSTGWRGTLLWTVVAVAVGLLVNAMIAEQRRQARIADDRTQQVVDLQAVFASIAQVARRISVGAEARDLICAVALEAGGASLATIVEPQPRGGFAITGSAGLRVGQVELDSVGPSATAFYSGRPIFVPDVPTRDGSAEAQEGTSKLASILCEPILIGERVLGVLCVGWADKREDLDARNSAICSYLAAEAAAVIERAELVAHLDGLASTDPLTGVANRRGWDEPLEEWLRTRTEEAVLHRDARP